jgi:hypothetical protein
MVINSYTAADACMTGARTYSGRIGKGKNTDKILWVSLMDKQAVYVGKNHFTDSVF